MFPEARSGRTSSVQARPLAELLECPAEIGNLLNGTARCIDVDVGEVVFRQSETCGGLYVVVSGQFLRRAERLETRLNLGVVRAGSVLLLPIGALNRALENFPPLRMRLLEELAREVSRGYEAGRRDLASNSRQRSFSVSSAQA
jgi:CRP-like cAMP-binding protein